MTDSIDLNPDETHACLAVLKALKPNATRWPTLAELLYRWQRFVVAAQTGYANSIYEYKNDLTNRDLLEQISTKVPPEIQIKIAGVVTPLDEQYQSATRPVTRALAAGKPEAWWWWHRVPVAPSAELAADLATEGLF